MLRVERDLAAARLAADRDGGTDRLEAAVAMLREASTPFHLGHGLVDLAEHLVAAGRDGDAAPLLTEATTIAEGLGAAPLATRAAAVAGSVRTTLAVE
jgi:hypothetical protein